MLACRGSTKPGTGDCKKLVLVQVNPRVCKSLGLLIIGQILLDKPVVPHKAVAEVSKIGNYRRVCLLSCMDDSANPLTD